MLGALQLTLLSPSAVLSSPSLGAAVQGMTGGDAIQIALMLVESKMQLLYILHTCIYLCCFRI